MKPRLLLIAVISTAATVTNVRTAVMASVATLQSPRSGASEQAVIDDLVLANRMLASSEAGVFDVTGEVSIRSRTNPRHFFIARRIAPGLVTATDILEHDVDDTAASVQRQQSEDLLIHSAIYKQRPDVAAIVYAHAPDLVAFSASTVPFYRGNDRVPVIAGPKSDGQSDATPTAALDQAVASALGARDALLLANDGAIVVGRTIYNAVADAIGLRGAAQTQAGLVAMGVKWTGDPLRPAANAPAPPQPLVLSRSGGGFGGTERTWDYYKQIVTSFPHGSASHVAKAKRTATRTTEEHMIDELVIANQIISYRVLGLVDALGHISVRSQRNPKHYYISRNVSAAFVTRSDIIENDLDSKPVAGARSDEFQEAYIHGEIYKARPDVIAILHAHTPEIRIFSLGLVTLRPIINDSEFISDGLPEHDIRNFDPRETLIRTPTLGRSLAAVLAEKPGVLLKGHGIALTGLSLADVIQKAYALRKNAQIQKQAIALGGQVTYIPNAARVPRASGTQGWDYWRELVSAK